MKLSEYLKLRKGKLKNDITTADGEIRKRGDIVYILMKNSDGTYHAEDNEWACLLNYPEDFEFI